MQSVSYGNRELFLSSVLSAWGIIGAIRDNPNFHLGRNLKFSLLRFLAFLAFFGLRSGSATQKRV